MGRVLERHIFVLGQRNEVGCVIVAEEDMMKSNFSGGGTLDINTSSAMH